MHTNILINSNFETFSEAYTILVYTPNPTDEFFGFCFYCFHSRKNMTMLQS